MRQKTTGGFGKFVYMEWLIPVRDYYLTLRRNEVIFEIIIPMLVSTVCTVLYNSRGRLLVALKGLADLLPTVISILIGFTIMLITLLLTSSGPSIDKLKEMETKKILYKQKVTLFQELHIQFSHSLFSEIFLLLIIFMYLFLYGLGIADRIGVFALAIQIYLTLNILFSILRGIANLYFSFYK